MTITGLLYNGKPMDCEPVNRSLEDTALTLRYGNTIVAELEPGDATYYVLCIVPCWGNHVAEHLGQFGVQASQSGNYLLVTYLDNSGGQTAWIPIDGKVMPHHTEPLSDNPWSQELFAWWLNQLNAAVPE